MTEWINFHTYQIEGNEVLLFSPPALSKVENISIAI